MLISLPPPHPHPLQQWGIADAKIMVMVWPTAEEILMINSAAHGVQEALEFA